MNEVIFFSLFLLFIFLMLALDLGVLNKKKHKPGFWEALTWTCIWIGISIAFYFLIKTHGNLIHGSDTWEAIHDRIIRFNHPVNIDALRDNVDEAIAIYNKNLALEYLTGYLIEYSLSVDNIFVIIMIFFSFNIRQDYYKKVLFWGILGAVVMRFLFIFAASALIQQFNWFLTVFGVLLVFLGIRMGYQFFSKKNEDVIDTERHPVVRFASRWFSVTRQDHGDKFWVRIGGKFFITPLFLVLMIIEFADVLFAVDSVPAVFSITQDPYIVFFSNIFAILGLRSLFFLVIDVINRFQYLKLGLALLLTFVGLKMILHYLGWIHLSTSDSLYIIVAILVASTLASVIKNLFVTTVKSSD
ncbi:MAG: TerC/Alx family metal homeostasis membrane protein [Bacteroidales bacterium]|nr:TerC/Alx family metal homeostasis membrane protein [Bacteroidales bacterium]